MWTFNSFAKVYSSNNKKQKSTLEIISLFQKYCLLKVELKYSPKYFSSLNHLTSFKQ